MAPVRVPEAMLSAVAPATAGASQDAVAVNAPSGVPAAAQLAAEESGPINAQPPAARESSTTAPSRPADVEAEGAANAASSSQTARQPADADASRAGDSARDTATEARAASSNASEASRAQRANAAAGKPTTDPLAKLIESARIVVERSANDRSGASASASAQAIAGRLNDVEVSVARDRAAKAIDGGFLQREGAAASAAGAAPVATASATANAVQPASGPIAPAGATFPIDAGTAGASPAPDLALPTEADAHPSVQLAAKGIAILGNQRGGAITMRLEPPALGQLRIELQIQQGAVVADFTAATPEARVLLEANLGMLRERLESQGLSVERISVHGGRGTESASPVAAPAGSDARQEGGGARSDSGDRGDRSGARQDAAGGESRGRRDGDARAQRDRMDAARTGEPRGFAAALHGETALRTEPMRRAS
ncbi:MAG: hypothetical protein RLZZ116_2493 [Planctomycetota bacterium]